MSDSLDAIQEDYLRDLIRQHGLQSVEERIVERAEITIALEAAPENSSAAEVGATRLGGLPDVPEGWQWPEDLTFLAQINCAEIASHDPQGRLPPRGLLLFFHNYYADDANGLTPHVEWIEDAPDGSRELERTKAPRGYLPMSLRHGGDGREVYTPLRVAPRARLSLPALYSQGWQEICAPDDEGNELTEKYLALLGALNIQSSERCSHQLFGQHRFMDGDADAQAWEAAHGVSSRLIGHTIDEVERAQTLAKMDANIAGRRELQHEQMTIYYQKQRDNYLCYLAHKDEADEELNEWTLLLQIDSDDRLHMSFNDAGFTYFMIRRGDLAAQRFDRVYNGMWSS